MHACAVSALSVLNNFQQLIIRFGSQKVWNKGGEQKGFQVLLKIIHPNSRKKDGLHCYRESAKNGASRALK